MSLSSAANNPQYNDPNSSLMQGQPGTLSNNPEGALVTGGAGGSSVVVPRDALIPPGPSQLGLPGTQQGMGATFAGAIQSDFPALVAGMSTQNFGDILTSLFVTAQPSTSRLTDDDTANDTFSFFSSQASTFKIEDSSSFDGLSAKASVALEDGLGSVDPEKVFNAILSYVSIDDNPLLSPEQKELLTGKMKQLSALIAQKNSSGEDSVLQSANPEEILTALKDMLQIDKDPTLSEEDQAALENSLSSVASSLGALNSASGASAPADPIYTKMNSKSSDDVYSALSQIASKSNVFTSQQMEELTPQLKALALQISQSNADGGVFGLESVEPDTVSKVLTSLINAENNPLLSDGTKTLLKLFVTAASMDIATTNKAAFTTMTFSTDPAVVQQGLVGLSNLKHNERLSPKEASASEDYLRVLAKALSFMSSIRATILMLEGEFRKAEAQGKLGMIHDQTRMSLVTFSKGMKEIATQLQKNLDEIKKQLILKILFPFITLIMAILAVVLIVVTLGAATPVAMGLIAATVALAGFTLLDQTTGMIEKACKAGGIKDDAAKAGINLAIQASVAVIASIFTFGLMAPIMAGGMATKTLAEAMRSMSQAAANITKAEGIMIGMTAVTTLFSSGIITAALTKIFKAAGMKDDIAAILAMLITLVLMLVMLVAAVKMLGDVGEVAAKSGVQGAENSLQVAKESTKAAETAVESAKEAAKNARAAAKQLADESEAAQAAALKARVEIDDLINAGKTVDDSMTQASKAATDKAVEIGEKAAIAQQQSIDAATALKEAEKALVASQVAESAALAEVEAAKATGKVNDTVGVSGSVTSASSTPAQSSSEISQMLQKLGDRAKEIFENPDVNELLRIVMILQGAASAAEFTSTIAFNAQSIGLNQQQIELTREIAAAQAAIEELKTFVPFFDASMDGITKDSNEFVKFFSDILNLFAQMVASASDITSQMHRTS